MTKKALLFAAMSFLAAGCSGTTETPDAGVDAGSVVDAGFDAGQPDAGRACTAATQATDCVGTTAGTYETCNNLVCGSCAGTNACGWGDLCGATGACAAIGLDTCGRAASAPAFNPANQGPLITAITATHFSTSDTNTECADGLDRIDVSITFQAGPNGLTTHSTQLDFNTNHVRYIKADGSITDPAYSHQRPAANATSGTFIVGLCGISSLTDGAFFLKDEAGNSGNAACVSTN